MASLLTEHDAAGTDVSLKLIDEGKTKYPPQTEIDIAVYQSN